MEDNSLETVYRLYRESVMAGERLNLAEEDLIDVFDFAGDVNDDFVRLQTLIEAAIRFPESDGMRVRKAVFLSTLTDEAVSDYLQTPEARHGGQMWAIFTCRAERPKGDEAERRLRAIAEMDDDFEDDEAIIQFVALAKYLNKEEWLWKNLPYLKKRCSEGKQTLLFEMARMAEGRDGQLKAITLLEALTTDNPFYVDYWSLISELQANCEKYDDAVMSVDYALALAPDDPEMYSMKGYILVKAQRYAEAVPVLKKALEMGAAEYSAKRNLIEALRMVNPGSEYRSMLFQLQAENPGEQPLLLQTLCLVNDEIDGLLEGYYAVNEPDEGVMLQHVNELCAQDKVGAAMSYLQWYKAKFGLSSNSTLMLLELYYADRRFTEAYELICTDISNFDLTGNQLTIICTIAAVLIRGGYFADAKDFCARWLKQLDENEGMLVPFRVITRGVKATIEEYLDFLNTNPEPTSKQIDQLLG